jgi:Plasmid pRiA4b ORF-3-like protein
MKNKNILQLKITLNDSTPKIWRRIQVPAEYTFFDLHVAIQDAVGWEMHICMLFGLPRKELEV